MGVASLVSGLNNERMELTDFFVCLYKFMQIKNLSGGQGPKWVQPVCWLDSIIIDHIWRVNR